MQEDRNMISSNINSYHDVIGGGLMIFHIIENKEYRDDIHYEYFLLNIFLLMMKTEYTIFRVITIRIFKSKNMH